MNFAAQGDVAGVLQRLADGVSPNVTNPIGQTALHIAAIWNHVEVATVLKLYCSTSSAGAARHQSAGHSHPDGQPHSAENGSVK